MGEINYLIKHLRRASVQKPIIDDPPVTKSNAGAARLHLVLFAVFATRFLQHLLALLQALPGALPVPRWALCRWCSGRKTSFLSLPLYISPNSSPMHEAPLKRKSRNSVSSGWFCDPRPHLKHNTHSFCLAGTTLSAHTLSILQQHLSHRSENVPPSGFLAGVWDEHEVSNLERQNYRKQSEKELSTDSYAALHALYLL